MSERKTRDQSWLLVLAHSFIGEEHNKYLRWNESEKERKPAAAAGEIIRINLREFATRLRTVKCACCGDRRYPLLLGDDEPQPKGVAVFITARELKTKPVWCSQEGMNVSVHYWVQLLHQHTLTLACAKSSVNWNAAIITSCILSYIQTD